MWRDAILVCAKDLRIEVRSRVFSYQVAIFAGLSLVLFAFALDADAATLRSASGGLFWIAVLFSAVLAVERSCSLEGADGAGDAVRTSGLDPAGVFVGKALAIAAQLAALEVVLAAAIALLYHAHLAGFAVLAASCILATAGIASAGTIYGALSATTRVRETLLPLLFLPVTAPVLLSAARAWQLSLSGAPGQGAPWLRILGVFAAVYVAAGVFAYRPILEQA